MLDGELSPGARLVYQYLDGRAGSSDDCWPSQETIAAALGMSLRSVERHVHALVASGHVEKMRRPRRQGFGGGVCYRLSARDLPARLPAKNDTYPPKVAGGYPPTVAGLIPITESSHVEPIPQTPKPGNEPMTISEFREIEDGYERHLKYHRTEPKDLVLQTLMSLSDAGKFDWTRYRERHAEWCASQERAGWRFCTLTFLAWVRAGMPKAPPDPIPINGAGKRKPTLDELLEMNGD